MKKKMWRTGLCGLTACSMLFTMPALAWAADEPQNTNIDNGLIAYYDFENVNEKKVPNVKDQSKCFDCIRYDFWEIPEIYRGN